MSQTELKGWMHDVGYEVSLSKIKNAGSALLNEQVVPATAEVNAFLQTVKSFFPALETERFLIVEAKSVTLEVYD